jgi:hypothetical protein
MSRALGDGSLIAVVGMSCRLPQSINFDARQRSLDGGQSAELLWKWQI